MCHYRLTAVYGLCNHSTTWCPQRTHNPCHERDKLLVWSPTGTLLSCLEPASPKRRPAPARPRKLNVDMLKRDEVKSQLQVKLDDILACDQQDAMPSVEEDWKHIKDATYKVAADILGYQVKRHHQDWFDGNDTEARALLDSMYAQHLTWINDKNSKAKKTAYAKARQPAQVKLRSMKENWWIHKSQERPSHSSRECSSKICRQVLLSWQSTIKRCRYRRRSQR